MISKAEMASHEEKQQTLNGKTIHPGIGLSLIHNSNHAMQKKERSR
jgi:hypothetical protein